MAVLAGGTKGFVNDCVGFVGRDLQPLCIYLRKPGINAARNVQPFGVG